MSTCHFVLLRSVPCRPLPARYTAARRPGGTGGFEAQLQGVGDLVLTPERLAIPGLGEFSLAFHPVWGAFWEQYWVWGSWHLFWWGFVALLLAASLLRPRPLGFSLYLFSIAATTVIAATFFLTENYLWAESVTALNRVSLQVVPALVFVAGSAEPRPGPIA